MLLISSLLATQATAIPAFPPDAAVRVDPVLHLTLSGKEGYTPILERLRRLEVLEPLGISVQAFCRQQQIRQVLDMH